MHQKVVNPRDNEITSLIFVIQSIAVQLVNKEYKIRNTIDTSDQGGEKLNDDKLGPEILLKWEICNY